MVTYYVFGTLFTVWALVVGGFGLRDKGFPAKGTVPIIIVTALLCIGTLSSAIAGGIAEKHEKAEEAAAAEHSPAE